MKSKRGLTKNRALCAASLSVGMFGCSSDAPPPPMNSGTAGETTVRVDPVGGSSGMGPMSMGGSETTGGFAGMFEMGGGGTSMGGMSAAGMSGASGSGNAGGFGGMLSMGGAAGMGGSAGTGSGGNHVFDIRFDYRFDTVGFFDVPERRAALEAAGAVWSRVLRDDFNTVPAGTRIRLRDPENRDEYVWVESIEEEIDDLIVFVGTSEDIPGLGRGGTAGVAQSEDPDVQADFATRSQGPDFEPWAGSISFKASSDWFFDPTPDTSDDIPFEQFDFTTNAVHEIGHVLGFTSGNVVFEAFIDGMTYVGPTAVEIYGGPVPLAEDLSHFVNGTELDGVEPVMDTGQTNGTRSVPGPLDLAVLADLGYEIADDAM